MTDDELTHLQVHALVNSLDNLTLNRLSHYYGDGGDVKWKRPREITIKVLNEAVTCDKEWSLVEFSQLYDQAVAQIPEEYRPQAVISFCGDADGDVGIGISYKRLESPEEAYRRIQSDIPKCREFMKEDRGEEYQLYLALKAKFEA